MIPSIECFLLLVKSPSVSVDTCRVFFIFFFISLIMYFSALDSMAVAFWVAFGTIHGSM